MRRILRIVVTGVTVGALGIGSAWAGASLGPTLVGSELGDPLDRLQQELERPGQRPAADAADGQDGTAAAASDASRGRSVGEAKGGAIAGGVRLPDGWFRAGAAERSLVPPEDRWTPASECAGRAPEQIYTPLTPEGCLITFDQRWADGVDPDNPILVRAAAIGNGEDAVVYAALDLVGYMAAYPLTSCGDCGIAAITEDLSDELRIPAANFVVASTHTHAAPSTIADGPIWYYEHVRDQIKAAIRAAVADAERNPQVRIETGATSAKAFNTDRRIVNRAVPDYELGWLRAYTPRKGNAPDQTVLTIGNFAVHSTIRAGNARLHGGLVGPFADRLRSELGGAGLFFPGGLGDQRVDRGYGVHGHGVGLADLIVEDVARGGHTLRSNDIAVATTEVRIPVENQFFAGALATGYAIRDVLPPFGGGPLVVNVERGGANRPVCTGAGALHVVGPVSAIRLGAEPPPGKRQLGDEFALPVETDNVVLVQAPGEIFASIALIVKDYLSRSDNVLVMGMANDTLGYMLPENQYDLFASQGLGLANNATGLGNYEEALSLGRCSGEIVTKAMLEVGQALGVMGEGERP
jgi:hypothetical protein